MRIGNAKVSTIEQNLSRVAPFMRGRFVQEAARLSR
jgi:hypothetical protein